MPEMEVEIEMSFSHIPVGSSPGISPFGLRQALVGENISLREDRQAIARILRALGNSPMAMAGIRTEMLNNKYPENY